VDTYGLQIILDAEVVKNPEAHIVEQASYASDYRSGPVRTSRASSRVRHQTCYGCSEKLFALNRIPDRAFAASFQEGIPSLDGEYYKYSRKAGAQRSYKHALSKILQILSQ